MKTQLNAKAYLTTSLFLFIPLFAWYVILSAGLPSGGSTEKIFGIAFFIHVLCWSILIFMFFTEYWQYECTEKEIIMWNLITKSKNIIPLDSISHIEMQRHYLKNGHYHNIKIMDKNTNTTILKCIFVEDTEKFFNYLKSKIG